MPAPNAVTPNRYASGAIGLHRPMLGVRMKGDPIFDDAEAGVIADLDTRRAVQYAAAMLIKNRLIGDDDLSNLLAKFTPPATVRFELSNEARDVLIEFIIPARVLEYDPTRALLEAHY